MSFPSFQNAEFSTMKTNDSWGYPASLNIRSRMPHLLPDLETPFDNIYYSSFLLHAMILQTLTSQSLDKKDQTSVPLNAEGILILIAMR